jgi:hypothetical protein
MAPCRGTKEHGAAVAVLYVRLDRFDQRADTCEAGASDASGRDLSKPAFDEVRQPLPNFSVGWITMQR